MSKIKKSKNVIIDPTISAGGNIHIGDVVNNYNTVAKEETEVNSTEKEVIAKEARKLIATNKIKEVLTYLEKEVGGIDGEISKQIAQQSAKWNKYKKEERIGILTEEQKGVQFSRIINSLLEIVGELQEG